MKLLGITCLVLLIAAVCSAGPLRQERLAKRKALKAAKLMHESAGHRARAASYGVGYGSAGGFAGGYRVEVYRSTSVRRGPCPGGLCP